MLRKDPATDVATLDGIKAFVADKSFPCVGAKSALNRDRMRMSRFGDMAGADTTQELWKALVRYSQEFPDPGSAPVSFVAVFDEIEAGDEATFECLLWRQLQALHDHDHARGIVWDRSVNSDPSQADFSFSVGGRAFFVVGMHPGASRMARRAPSPCIVFNFHNQFESLKASGKYAGMQDAIRIRDTALQGSVNPVLARFGDSSEAVQYSGRAADGAWKCPFSMRGAA
ncbi:MAG: YqcI/YcgG family protein [Variovorax sp.]|nr:MAG: YqcI/YcgG family protein [Variovorax sp.]